jgi:invasion protein IalB
MPKIGLTPLARALAVALALTGPAAADPPAVYGARRAEAVTFRDWRLHCQGPACALRGAVRGGDGSVVLSAALEGQTLRLETALPLFLPDGVTLALGEDPLRAIPWRTCDPRGCRAETPLDADLLDSLRRERAAEVTLTLLDQVRIRLPVSLLGLSAALKAGGEKAPAPPVTAP